MIESLAPMLAPSHAQRKRALRRSLSGYQENLELLMTSGFLRMPVGLRRIRGVDICDACRCFPAQHGAASDGGLACNARRLQPMHRTAIDPIHARFPHGGSIGSLARRWYYTPRSHRAYSVRQISPGDRRLLAEFALALTQSTPDRELCGRPRS